jgi:hypothetical protein
MPVEKSLHLYSCLQQVRLKEHEAASAGARNSINLR